MVGESVSRRCARPCAFFVRFLSVAPRRPSKLGVFPIAVTGTAYVGGQGDGARERVHRECAVVGIYLFI